MTDFVYTDARARLASGGLDWGNADLRVLLLDAAGTYVPDPSDVFVAELLPGANELDATNYQREPLTGRSVEISGDEVELIADDVTWVDLADGDDSPYPSVQALVIFEQVTDDSDSRLVAWIESGAGQTNGLTATAGWVDGVVLDMPLGGGS